MRYLRNVRLLMFALCGAVTLMAANRGARADDWGTIKGQVVYGGDKPPEQKVLEVTKDKDDCLATKKKLLSEDWVVDSKTMGVKWVYVWLVPDSRKKEDLIKPIPIHPDLKAKAGKLPNAVIDQPCCLFEPYATAIQEGQSITIKNSMTIAHNSKVDGDSTIPNPTVNPLIPGGGMVNVGPFKAQATEIPLSCSIHGWMSGHIRVFSHPYFCVTNEKGEFEIKDAPAGKYRLVIQHPGSGWVVGDKEPDKFGVVIDIKAKATTDLGKFKVMPPK